MKSLLILRHAKTRKALPGEQDFDRTLTERGRANAVALGRDLIERGAAPDLILASPAARTRETAEILIRDWKEPPAIELVDALYNADAETVRAQCVERLSRADRVMVVGHNPGLHILAMALADDDRSALDALTRLAAGFPTCALAEFEAALGDDGALAGSALKRLDAPGGD